MTTSPKMLLPSAISSDERIDEGTLAFLEQRALNQFYDYVFGRFLDAQEASQLTKAILARRIGRKPDHVGHLLSSPANWTIGTVARLLAGIVGEEPILASKSLFDRAPKNRSVMDLLEDEDDKEGVIELENGAPPVASVSKTATVSSLS